MNRFEARGAIIAEIHGLEGHVDCMRWHGGGRGTVLWHRPYPPRPTETEWAIHDIYNSSETVGIESGRYFHGDAARERAIAAFREGCR